VLATATATGDGRSGFKIDFMLGSLPRSISCNA
jgi:hypothetical protein